MFKVVCFPDYGCGGILCASLNYDNVPILSNGEIPSEYHEALKFCSSISSFDESEWNAAKSRCIKWDYDKFWLGTHAHPSHIINDPQVEIILYVNVASMESRCLLAARQCKSESHYKIECMKLCLTSRYKDNMLWTKLLNDPKVIQLDFYHLINSPSYRNTRLKQHGITFDANLWDEWYRYNDFRNDANLIMQEYAKLNMHV